MVQNHSLQIETNKNQRRVNSLTLVGGSKSQGGTRIRNDDRRTFGPKFVPQNRTLTVQ